MADSVIHSILGGQMLRSWRRALLVLMISAVAWISLALSGWMLLRLNRNLPVIGLVDILLPSHWAQISRAVGDHYIGQAISLIQQRRALEGYIKLRKGVAKSPSNATGRILLAKILEGGRRADLAQDILLGGVAHIKSDSRYLQYVLEFLLRQGEYSQVSLTSERLLRSKDLPLQTTTQLAHYAALASYHRGHFDQAEELINRFRLHETAAGTILQARLDWERGFPDLALLRLTAGLARFPNDESVCRHLGHFYLESDRLAEGEANAVRLLALNPLAPEPRVAFIALCERRHDEAHLAREVALYLGHFARQPAALVQLAEFAASTGRVALVRQIHGILHAQEYPSEGSVLLLAEALMVDRQYQAALDELAAFQKASPPTGAAVVVVSGIRLAALHGLHRWDEARLELDALLAQKNLRADNLLAVARRLASLEARDSARRLLARAVSVDPRNQAALTELVRLEIADEAAAELAVHLPRLLRMRRPAREVLASAAELLGHDRYLFFPGQASLLDQLRPQPAVPAGG